MIDSSNRTGSDRTTGAHRWDVRSLTPMVLAVLVLWALTQGPVYTLWARDPDAIDLFAAPTAIVTTFLVLYVLVGYSLGRLGTPPRRVDLVEVLIGALVLLVAASTLWSVAPAITVGAAAGLAGAAMSGLWFRCRFAPTDQAVLVFIAMGIGVAWSGFALWRGWPTARDEWGLWVGLYFNRNSLAPVAAICLLASCFVLPRLVSRHRRSAGLLVGALVCIAVVDVVAVVLLIGSKSRTSLFALAAAVIVCTAVATARRWVTSPRARAGLVAGLVVAGVAVVAVSASWISGRLGRDTSLNGRNDIWSVVLQRVRERPVIGWGFDAAWYDPAFREPLSDGTVLAPVIREAHNGYLELLLGAGPVALLLGIAAVAIGMVRAVKCALAGSTAIDLFPVALIAFCATANLLETFVSPNHFLWLLLVAALLTSSGDTALPHRAVEHG